MEIYPAIDIFGGQCVRLTQGDYQQQTTYRAAPLEQAREFESQGAVWLHVVDLDAARTGTQQNLSAIAGICEGTGLRVQVGGGVRDEAAAERLRSAGVARVVVGTSAIEDPGFVRRLAESMPTALALDVRDGKVAVRGWQQSSESGLEQVLGEFSGTALECVIATDIARDGMLSGPNHALYEEVMAHGAAAQDGWDVIASGGVSQLEHLRTLAAAGLSGAIVGKALYENEFSLAQALAAAKEPGAEPSR